MARYGEPSDYEAPFMDQHLNHPRRDEFEVERVVAIGREELLAWWRRVKKDTHPATYGHSGSEFTESVAACLELGLTGTYSNPQCIEASPHIRAVRAAYERLTS